MDSTGRTRKQVSIFDAEKPFWHNPLPFPDWKWYYKSVSETGVINARDSFTVMNHADMTYDETPFEVFGVESWSDCDTVTLPVRGLYTITYDCSVIFPYTEVSGINERDSVILRVVNELSVDILRLHILSTGSHFMTE